MKGHPAQGRFRLLDAQRGKRFVEEAYCVVMLLSVVSPGIHGHDVAIGKSSPFHVARGKRTVQKTAGVWAVGDELHAMFTDKIHHRAFVPTINEIVDTLVNGRLDISFALADVDEFGKHCGREVADSEL